MTTNEPLLTCEERKLSDSVQALSVTDYRSSGVFRSTRAESRLMDNKSFQCWLKVTSYSSNIFYVILMFIFITTGVIVEEYYYFDVHDNDIHTNNPWHQYVIETSWMICAFSLFFIIHYNLTYKSINIFFDLNFNHNEYYIYVTIFLSARIGLRAFPIIQMLVNEGMDEEHLQQSINNIATFIINTITMFTLCVIILTLTLSCVHKYDKLIIIVKNNHLSIDAIKQEIDKINKFTKRIKSDWQIAASILFCYIMTFAIIYISVWFLNDDDVGFQYYHGYDEYVQFTLIVIRTSMWLYGLLYGIVRMNAKPAHLASVINKHCNWNNSACEQAKIQRLTTRLLQFPICFKVIFVSISWKHFAVVIVSSVTSLAGALMKTKFS